MTERPDERPFIFAVDPDPQAIQRITGELQRYSADYEVVCGPSPEAALAQLERMRDAGERVAIVLAARGGTGCAARSCSRGSTTCIRTRSAVS